jgi:glycosyltransferase involved in cell wall biosynthesis
MRRLMMTAFGWNDSGGGTTVPRLAAKELARRGWEVTVFHAAVAPLPDAEAYAVREFDEDGVHLIAVHNRAHGLFDHANPWRELDDPPITAAFAAALERARPDVVHFHNLHNLGAALMDEAGARGLPAYFSTHNYWLVCPRAYLMRADGAICPGPGDGSRCASCAGGHDPAGYVRRLAEIRARAQRHLSTVLAVSDAVRRTLLAAGYPAELVDVVRQAMPHEERVWAQVGRDRAPGRAGGALTVAFLGSAYPHKGPQLLVQAAQRVSAPLRVRILGEVPARFAHALRAQDRRGVVEITGAFAPDQIGELLREVDAVVLPSLWWDCAPLAAAECRAARVPLLVPRLGGLPEVVRDGVDGLHFEALNAGSLAVALERLATEPGLLERLQGAVAPPRPFAAYVDELEAYYAGERPSASARRADLLTRPPAVRWQGDHGRHTSLSIVNHEVCSRLPGPVQRVRVDGSAVDPPLPHAADVEVRHQWPPDFAPPPAGRLVILQPWEFGALPEAWLEPLRGADEIWVPSEYVRAMYVGAGLDPARVVTIPNGVDLERFHPAPEAAPAGQPLRFLFVGGLIARKGADLLLPAWRRAFAGRDDVVLTIKDFGSGDLYRGGQRDAIRAWAASGSLPRVELAPEELSPQDMAALYRSADVLVHPYRGEGFAMPVLEAMASGLPAIVTAGGPTDEFCPPEAGWRIRSRRLEFPSDAVDHMPTAGRPWMLDPDLDHLVELLCRAAADPSELRRRGAAARLAAERWSWDAIAGRYAERLRALAASAASLARLATVDPWPFERPAALRVLATPAWRGADALPALLAEWCTAAGPGDDASLCLLADPETDGSPEELEAHILAAAARAGVGLDGCADIEVLMAPGDPGRDERLHAAADAYVPLHGACAGHERLARWAGNHVLALGRGELAAHLRDPTLAAA